MRRIHVSLIGGEHQFLHIVPIAAWLSRQSDVSVCLFSLDEVDERAADAIMQGLGANAYEHVRLDRNPLLALWKRIFGAWGEKPMALLANSRKMRRCKAMLVAERTSVILTYLPGRQPLYVRVTHGVGDREKGFNKRARAYDHFIVAGRKYAERFVETGIARPEQISVGGYIKIPALRTMKGERAPLFDNQRPVIVYNAHFDPKVSSWNRDARKLIETILADGRYNLVVAPHIRLFDRATVERRKKWLAYAEPGHCIVDLGSAASTNMRYIDGADLYLGDASSQVYEFIAEPRPVLFVNSHKVTWRALESHRHWHFGEVIDDAGAIIAAIDRAMARPRRFPGHTGARERLCAGRYQQRYRRADRTNPA